MSTALQLGITHALSAALADHWECWRRPQRCGMPACHCMSHCPAHKPWSWLIQHTQELPQQRRCSLAGKPKKASLPPSEVSLARFPLARLHCFNSSTLAQHQLGCQLRQLGRLSSLMSHFPPQHQPSSHALPNRNTFARSGGASPCASSPSDQERDKHECLHHARDTQSASA